jgi:hypothetical protein
MKNEILMADNDNDNNTMAYVNSNNNENMKKTIWQQ